jgi:hypothetical protein
MKRSLLVLALAALLAPALAACGGSPATMATLPTFPSATELQAGENAVADSVAESLKSSVGGNLSSEVKLFSLPQATTWDEVKAFYGEALQGGDWKAAAELDSSSDTISTAGWQRGGLASEQVLMLGFVPPLLGEGPVLIVSLFSE